MKCCECMHPVMEGMACPFCGSLERAETCTTCNSIAIKPPGAEQSFCPNCAFEKGMELV